MRRATVVAVLAAVVVSLLSVVPAQSAEAAPPKRCIYMVKNLERAPAWYGEPSWWFEFVVWKKRGTKIVGLIGAVPSEAERHRLTYKPRKNRAVGLQEDWITGEEYPKSYKTVGKGKKLRVKGYQLVTKKRMAQLTNSIQVGVPGCQA